jgi:DnaJ-domain-containing protein 1
MGRIIVTSDEDGYIYLKIVDSRDEFRTIINIIKETVPFYRRTFIAESKVWRFMPEAREDVNLLIANLRPLVDLEIMTTSELEDPYSVLCVVRTAPFEVIQAAYKALAKKHHPDTGGDTEMMKRINSAFDTIKRLRGQAA